MIENKRKKKKKRMREHKSVEDENATKEGRNERKMREKK